MAAQIQDARAVLGNGRRGSRMSVLVVGGILAAAGFALAAPVYWWLVW